MSRFHELHGQVTDQLCQLQEYHSSTQKLLRELLEGKILPSQLAVSPEGWQISEAPKPDNMVDFPNEPTSSAQPIEDS